MDNQILGLYFELNKTGQPLPNSWQLSKKFDTPHNKIVGALKSLKSGEYLVLTGKKEQKFKITKEGKHLGNVSRFGYIDMRI